VYDVFNSGRYGAGVHRICDDRECARNIVSQDLMNGVTTITITLVNQDRIPVYLRKTQQPCCDACGYTIHYAWMTDRDRVNAEQMAAEANGEAPWQRDIAGECQRCGRTPAPFIGGCLCGA
jgi:hypothetical protein